MKKYSIGQFAKLIGKTTQTLRNWDESDRLKPAFIDERTGYRYYTANQMREINGYNLPKEKTTIGYCRVSSRKQSSALERQVQIVEKYLIKNGYSYEIITDIGSGIKYDKKGLTKMIEKIVLGEVDKIVVLHKDRLMRFGFELIKTFCDNFNVEILILENNESSPEEEIVKDLIQIITVFSCRLQGQRAHKISKLIREIQNDKDY